MIPLCSSAVRALRCFFTMFTPSTSTRPVLGKMRSTLPSLPRSSPRITRTVSPFDTRILMRSELIACRDMFRFFAVFLYLRALILQNLRRQRDDLHVFLLAELSRHGTEDTSRARLACIVDDHYRILVEADVRAVLAARLLCRVYDYCSRDLRYLHCPVG